MIFDGKAFSLVLLDVVTGANVGGPVFVVVAKVPPGRVIKGKGVVVC